METFVSNLDNERTTNMEALRRSGPFGHPRSAELHADAGYMVG